MSVAGRDSKSPFKEKSFPGSLYINAHPSLSPTPLAGTLQTDEKLERECVLYVYVCIECECVRVIVSYMCVCVYIERVVCIVQKVKCLNQAVRTLYIYTHTLSLSLTLTQSHCTKVLINSTVEKSLSDTPKNPSSLVRSS